MSGGEEAVEGADDSSRRLAWLEWGEARLGGALGVGDIGLRAGVSSWEVALGDRHSQLHLTLMSRCGPVTPASPSSVDSRSCHSLVATGHESLWGPEAAAEPGPGCVQEGCRVPAGRPSGGPGRPCWPAHLQPGHRSWRAAPGSSKSEECTGGCRAKAEKVLTQVCPTTTHLEPSFPLCKSQLLLCQRYVTNIPNSQWLAIAVTFCLWFRG